MEETVWEEAAECLKALSHPHRLHMIQLLLQRSYSVGELAEVCGIQPNVASEHLTLMKNKQFIEASRQGNNVFYTIKEPALAGIIACIQQRFVKKSRSSHA